jgi:hypothetical protein
VSERLQLRGDGAHDGDDDAMLEAIVNGAQGFESKHRFLEISDFGLQISDC